MKRGSALLIVLGMVAFMVVSAVGFAVFMRQNRLPSSFLRRNTASHQLVRSALARAMAEIDSSIGDNPYPGIGGGANRWQGRVLTPNNDVAPETTVTPLTFEGLAYLPPVLVNDVRYYSRRTGTACWKRLDYDSGRYAYVAVDVSDYFNLNDMMVEVPRGSGPSNLVTMAYLLENAGGTDYFIEPTSFQSYLDRIRADEGFVSLADYNLTAAGSGLVSPFVNYLRTGGQNGFYGFTDRPDPLSEEYLKIAAQRFITEGGDDLPMEEWYTDAVAASGSASGLTPLDISKSENQPFPDLLQGDDDTKNDMSAGVICEISTPFFETRFRQIQPCESIALYDYLDRDNVPASVAVPTVERTPMIVATELDTSQFSVSFEAVTTDESSAPAGPDNTVMMRKTVSFYPVLTGSLSVNAGFAFPFKYRSELNQQAGQFKAQAIARFYLEKTNAPRVSRTRIDRELGEWPDSAGEGKINYADNLFVLSSRSAQTKLPDNVTDESSAVSTDKSKLHDAELILQDVSGANSKVKSDEAYIVRYHLIKQEDQGDDAWILDIEAEDGPVQHGLCALDFVEGQSIQTAAGQEYGWGLSLAVRLYDSNGYLVDMAPAHINDDNDSPSDYFKSELGDINRPVLRFTMAAGAAGAITIKDDLDGYNDLLARAENPSATPVEFEQKAYLTDDPRYNFASENWYPATISASGSLGEAWLAQVTCNGGANKANDIFMSVSNQGYLQDPGELAFLPRVCGFNSPTEMQPIADVADGRIPSGPVDLGNAAQMWRTYGCFGDLGDDETDNLMLVSPVRGFRVNPYTDDPVISKAAFMNTPYDWWAAGTNVMKGVDSVKKAMIDADGGTGDLDASLACSFGPRGEETRVDAGRMREFSEKVCQALRSSNRWYEEYENLGWNNGSDTQLCGVDLGIPLHDVDRKYLYSYWRKCMANKQQLFIVFFRAEPVVLGGGTEGSTPAQLGARGVAVVWRDPYRSPGSDPEAPHRMRILFYHQFD